MDQAAKPKGTEVMEPLETITEIEIGRNAGPMLIVAGSAVHALSRGFRQRRGQTGSHTDRFDDDGCGGDCGDGGNGPARAITYEDPSPEVMRFL
jgi:hypothetical protein